MVERCGPAGVCVFGPCHTHCVLCTVCGAAAGAAGPRPAVVGGRRPLALDHGRALRAGGGARPPPTHTHTHTHSFELSAAGRTLRTFALLARGERSVRSPKGTLLQFCYGAGGGASQTALTKGFFAGSYEVRGGPRRGSLAARL
jgi:hypothetical protein